MTWDRRLYFPYEGRRAEDFFALKIRRLRAGLNPRTWALKASTLPLDHSKKNIQSCFTFAPSLKYHALNTCGWKEVQLHPFLTPALDKWMTEWSAWIPGCTPPLPTQYEGGWTPEAVRSLLPPGNELISLGRPTRSLVTIRSQSCSCVRNK